MTRLIDADKLYPDCLTKDGTLGISQSQIANAPTVNPQKIVTIPHELIEKLVLCVVDTVENIDWDKAIEAYKERPHGKWIDLNSIVDKAKCSNCKKIVITEPFGHFDFCPNCGAYMRGDRK